MLHMYIYFYFILNIYFTFTLLVIYILSFMRIIIEWGANIQMFLKKICYIDCVVVYVGTERVKASWLCARLMCVLLYV